MSGKRIAVFLDGTWNNSDSNTNVWRLRSLVRERDAAGKEQRVFYHAGVGTNRWEKVRGGALGYGLDGEILRAYRWLIENYDKGDEVFIFGFSRGAFTARSLAGLIATCGLLQPGAPLAVTQVYDRYRQHKAARPLHQLIFDHDHGRMLEGADKRLHAYSKRVPIKMLGVWDTVGALGIPFGNIPGLSRRSFRFLNTNLSVLYENAFHALAIDEHRAAFAPTLWTRFTPSALVGHDDRPVPSRARVEQRWFVGAHANVGGGYLDDDLPQRPLEWLKDKAESLGLAFRFPVDLDGTEQLGPITDSFAQFAWGLYRIARLFRRHHRIIAAPASDVTGGTSTPINEAIDATVFDRWRRDAHYRPPSLAAWAGRTGADPAALTEAVDAVTGQPLPH